MDNTSEKYPVCPNRNTAAALRRFFRPLGVLALLKVRALRLKRSPATRPIRRPGGAALP
jgi:hypothetical protein